MASCARAEGEPAAMSRQGPHSFPIVPAAFLWACSHHGSALGSTAERAQDADDEEPIAAVATEPPSAGERRRMRGAII